MPLTMRFDPDGVEIRLVGKGPFRRLIIDGISH